ncbi:alpha/beta fold hydrolase [Sphingomicrobium sediminis]|uniref:Palmitoyl-protein thioesterase ABHD10, mitochondrial n=1 Tax=Sphingomicrobium sediminis TaxID=2950949 RepID=A0A9X2J420_9SPHN|nr:alpha/beta hydrolase [Sphingomicrobium sediminis]MCM8557906.1 alpha/beta hydrolase [Sphingomicrobium sediminis]
MTQPTELRYLRHDDRRLAYRKTDGKGLTYLFLPGYASDMDGGKAEAIDLYAQRQGRSCLRFDYSGTGLSDGEFSDGTLKRWLDETLAMIDAHADGPVIAVGSSMGGWLALHAALNRPDRVKAILGIAAAPDFTNWGFSLDEKKKIIAEGKIERPTPYGPDLMVTHMPFFRSGEEMRLFTKPIPFTGPMRLVHGDKDTDVPIGVPLKLIEMVQSHDVQLRLIKNSGHRLSQPHEIGAIIAELHALDHQISNA